MSKAGITTLNKRIKGDCYVDRKLISGDGPSAGNEFARIAANALLEQKISGDRHRIKGPRISGDFAGNGNLAQHAACLWIGDTIHVGNTLDIL